MSDNKWTNEQLLAINTKGSNLLVAAGAGAGKTAVLVERIIKRITDSKDPIDIDRLLVVTFTNAAASEMRERIGDAITKELDENPDSKVLQRQLTLLPKSSITTIHSFCLEVIRNNFHKIDIDPAFRIADDTEIVLLRQEAIDELFENMYETSDNEDFKVLVESYGGSRDDRKLLEIVLDLYEFSQSSPWPSLWLGNALNQYNIDENFNFEESDWAKMFMQNIKLELLGLCSNMERAVSIMQRQGGFEPYIGAFKSESEKLYSVASDNNIKYDEFAQRLSEVSFDRLKSVKGVDDYVKKTVTDIRKKVKDRKKELQSQLEGGNEKVIKQINHLYPLMKSLIELALEFSIRMRAVKKEKGIVDFGDIEHFCLEILTDKDENGQIHPSETALYYRNKFEEVLIDEYQDSNLVQEVLLGMVSRKDSDIPNMFMVGDVKQSIYRFRQARPELFLEKYRTYGDLEGDRNRRITLYKNFRSRPSVIGGVNYIFSQIMSEAVGELNYTQAEKLESGAEYPEFDGQGITGGPVEINIIERKQREAAVKDIQELEEQNEDVAEQKNEDEEDIDSVKLEAIMVGKRIKELVSQDFMIYDKNISSYRKLLYKDIVVLLRATSSAAPVYLEEFGSEGIPAFADTNTGYFETIEIKTILSLLQIIDNPIQDIPLLAVLRSPIYSFTAEELINIRMEDTRVSFYEAMIKTSENNIDGLAIKIEDFINKLKTWQEKSLYMPVDKFIWYLYMQTGYYSYAGAMTGGVQRQANLKILFERARQYEQTSYRGLFNFISFIHRLKKSSGDMGSAKILGENENVVRIMSIHKSKGLEFPVVFVCGTGKGFNMMDLKRSILFHQDLGLGPDYVDYKRRISYSSIIKEALKTKIRLETLSEEMRILYVAFTRAKEKLIITGSVKDLAKSAGKWGASANLREDKLPQFEVSSAASYLDWICPAVIVHPESSALRDIAGVNDDAVHELSGDASSWDIRLWTAQDVLKDRVNEDTVYQDEKAKLEQIDSELPQSKYSEEIVRRLRFEYPYLRASQIPSAVSVSELKRLKNEEVEDENTVRLLDQMKFKKPQFLQQTIGLSGAEKGTVMHLVMQHLDFKKVDSFKEIKQQIDQMIDSELITKAQAASVYIKRIQDFFISPLGIRMLNSDNIKKEVPFIIKMSACNIYKDLPEDKYKNENIILRGIIDCYFEEEGEIVLIDYKTDYVTEDNKEEIIERYKSQLELYQKSLERMTGKIVKGKFIYLFSTGEIVQYR